MGKYIILVVAIPVVTSQDVALAPSNNVLAALGFKYVRGV